MLLAVLLQISLAIANFALGIFKRNIDWLELNKDVIPEGGSRRQEL